MQVVMGMDISPTGSALVTLVQGAPEAPVEVRSMLLLNRGSAKSRKAGDEHLKNMTIDNLVYVASSIGHELQRILPKLVMLEDYSGGNTENPFTLACTGEITGAAKLWMQQSKVEWHEVAASTLKKFTTGSGSGKKEAMWLGAYKKWGVDQSTLGDDNNVLDAYCLARMGLALLWHQLEVLAPAKYEAECFKSMRAGGAPRLSAAAKKKLRGGAA